MKDYPAAAPEDEKIRVPLDLLRCPTTGQAL